MLHRRRSLVSRVGLSLGVPLWSVLAAGSACAPGVRAGSIPAAIIAPDQAARVTAFIDVAVVPLDRERVADMHAHDFGLKSERDLLRYVAHGVTTVRNMTWWDRTSCC
jgi:hypothetical protein